MESLSLIHRMGCIFPKAIFIFLSLLLLSCTGEDRSDRDGGHDSMSWEVCKDRQKCSRHSDCQEGTICISIKYCRNPVCVLEEEVCKVACGEPSCIIKESDPASVSCES